MIIINHHYIGTVLPPVIIFRGVGTNLQNERQYYDKRVRVMWQPKTWADHTICLSWANTLFIPAISMLIQLI